MNKSRDIKALSLTSKVQFCREAEISRPTLYKYLRGEEVLPVIEQAIKSACDRIVSREGAKRQPAPA